MPMSGVRSQLLPLQGELSTRSLAPAASTAGCCASMASAGSFEPLGRYGVGGLPTVTLASVDAPLASAGTARAAAEASNATKITERRIIVDPPLVKTRANPRSSVGGKAQACISPANGKGQHSSQPSGRRQLSSWLPGPRWRPDDCTRYRTPPPRRLPGRGVPGASAQGYPCITPTCSRTVNERIGGHEPAVTAPRHLAPRRGCPCWLRLGHCGGVDAELVRRAVGVVAGAVGTVRPGHPPGSQAALAARPPLDDWCAVRAGGRCRRPYTWAQGGPSGKGSQDPPRRAAIEAGAGESLGQQNTGTEPPGMPQSAWHR